MSLVTHGQRAFPGERGPRGFPVCRRGPGALVRPWLAWSPHALQERLVRLLTGTPRHRSQARPAPSPPASDHLLLTGERASADSPRPRRLRPVPRCLPLPRPRVVPAGWDSMAGVAKTPEGTPQPPGPASAAQHLPSAGRCAPFRAIPGARSARQAGPFAAGSATMSFLGGDGAWIMAVAAFGRLQHPCRFGRSLLPQRRKLVS